MDARTSSGILLICLALGAPLKAVGADDYVAMGRARLFDGTPSGPARACDVFAAGLRDVSAGTLAPREALFLHALARTTVLLGNPNDVVVPNGMLRWIERFSAALAAGGSDSLSAWPHGGPCSALPPSAATEIDGIVAELDQIADAPASFTMHLLAKETGLRGNLEIDYGDVLMLKSVLLACRASLREQAPIEAELAAAGSILDRRVRRAVDTWLTGAPLLLGFAEPPISEDDRRLSWAAAVACYCDAVAHIAAEDQPPGADPQDDELVYIDPACLAAVGTALNDPAPPERDSGVDVYEVCDANSARLGELMLVFENPTGGRAGRFLLADGTSLLVDWFGLLDAGEIGISMAAADGATQGWLHGAITADRCTITEGTVELWGAAPRIAAGITARLTGDPLQPLADSPVPLAELLACADENDRGF